MDYIDTFQQTIEDSFKKLSSITEDESGHSSRAGKWTPKEIMGHLIDSAANNHQRFIRAQFKDDMIFPGYEQDDWVEVQRYNLESWAFLLQLWKTYNQHLIHVISNIPKTRLTRRYRTHNLHEIGWKQISEQEEVSLDYLIKDYIGHLEHHLKQVIDWK